MNYFKLLFNLFKLKRNTKKSREKILKLQEKKLRKILTYAYENSPYYNEVFTEVGITKDKIKSCSLSEIPTIDKNKLIENFNRLVTDPELNQEELRKFDEEESLNKKKYKDKYHIVHSSGSTGKPRYFVYDEIAWNSMLVGIIRAALWDMKMIEILNLLKSGPRIVYIAATSGRYGGAMAVGDGIEGIRAEQLFLDINLPLSKWLEEIKKFKPNIVIGYPSAIRILAELVEKGDIELDVIRVISCGEPLSRNLRKYLENIFSAKIVNIYGASESLALGVEVDEEEGMLLFDDMNYIEVEKGNMYLTCLYNFAQPLIRYKISDRLFIKSDYINSPFTKVENILGRNEDLLWFKDNNGNLEFLHPLSIEGFCIDGLVDYQFHQIDEKSFEIHAQIYNEQYEEDIEKELIFFMEKILYEKKLMFVKFSIQFVKEILPNPKTGKKNLVISR